MLQTGHPGTRELTFKSHGRTRLSSAREERTSASESAASPTRNLLLCSLPSEELARVRPHLVEVSHGQREKLITEDVPIEHVYFPETMVLSLVSTLHGGGTVEVATAGFEGMVGLPLFLGDRTSSVNAFVQIPGTAMRMDMAAFVALSRAPGRLHDLMLRYTTAFLTQVAQTAACNGVHPVSERCARWLLMAHDRVVGDRFPLTHHFLAFMLGVRRAGVSIAMGELQSAGMVSYSRGSIQIVDRVMLEEASCACYQAVRKHNDRLLPPMVSE